MPSTDTAIPAAKQNRAIGLTLIIAQLALIVVSLEAGDILQMAFRRVVYLAFACFLLHHFLPARFRLPFFVTLSIGCLALALGTPSTPEHFWETTGLIRAGLVIGLGVIFIGICRLPLAFWTRVGLLLAAGATAGLFRMGIFPSGGFEVIWIILAAMFMFRVIIYLYDVSTMPQRPSWTHSLAYFFLFPNVGYTLFPVIDFKTFCRSHYSAESLGIYQRGIQWIVRGIIQLILYRYANEIMGIPIGWIDTGADIVRFLVSNCLLYLNVSGSYHLITGLLLLYGFNLPETNHHYFLASSFTDYWRRANIYWKDFMIKVFYYPLYFRIKQSGATFALVVATIWTFFITWALHLYQTWWLKGAVSASVTDSLFWLILGVLVLGNSLWEAKRKKPRSLASRQVSVTETILLLLQTAGTFATIALLWSLWCSPGLSAWMGMWRHANWHTVIGCAAVLALVMAAKFVIDVLPGLRKPAVAAAPKPYRIVLSSVAPLLLLILLAQPAVQVGFPDFHLERFGAKATKNHLFEMLEAGDSFLNQKDEEEFNYYKNLTTLDEVNRQRMQIMMGRSVPLIPHNGNPQLVRTNDFRHEVLLPDQKTEAYETDDFSTNHQGLRDSEHPLAKAPGTLRIALLGSSHVMGYAVHLDQALSTLLEERLNREPPAGLDFQRIEIIDFAQPGWSPLSQISVIQEQVRPFQPDIVMIVGHLADSRHNNYRLRKAVQRGYPISSPVLQDILQKTRIERYTNDGLMEKRLQPFAEEIDQWALDEIVRQCRIVKAEPIFVFLPAIGFEVPLSQAQQKEAASLRGMATTAGFTYLDLSNIFAGQPVENLVTGIVPHSNALAHRIIANALYDQLTKEPTITLMRKVSRPLSTPPLLQNYPVSNPPGNTPSKHRSLRTGEHRLKA